MIVSDPLNYAGLSPRRPFSLLYQLQQKFHKLVIKKTKIINNIGSLFLLIFLLSLIGLIYILKKHNTSQKNLIGKNDIITEIYFSSV